MTPQCGRSVDHPGCQNDSSGRSVVKVQVVRVAIYIYRSGDLGIFDPPPPQVWMVSEPGPGSLNAHSSGNYEAMTPQHGKSVIQ